MPAPVFAVSSVAELHALVSLVHARGVLHPTRRFDHRSLHHIVMLWV